MLEGSQLFHRGSEEEGISIKLQGTHEFSLNLEVFWAIHQDPLSISWGNPCIFCGFPCFSRESMHFLLDFSQVFLGNPCNSLWIFQVFLGNPCIFCWIFPAFSRESMQLSVDFSRFSWGVHAISVNSPRFSRSYFKGVIEHVNKRQGLESCPWIDAAPVPLDCESTCWTCFSTAARLTQSLSPI